MKTVYDIEKKKNKLLIIVEGLLTCFAYKYRISYMQRIFNLNTYTECWKCMYQLSLDRFNIASSQTWQDIILFFFFNTRFKYSTLNISREITFHLSEILLNLN